VQKLRSRLPIILSATALVVALFGATPVGNAVNSVLFAKNAGKVDGIDASKTPKAGDLLALNGSKKFPASVVPTLPISNLDGGKCSQYGQNGSIDVQYVPDINFFNGFVARTMIAIECEGVVPPDQHEPNDSSNEASELLGGDNDGGTISPAGDVDWFRFDMVGLCGFEPGLCDTGMQIGLQSTDDAVTFDGYDEDPATTTADVSGVTFWNTGPIDTNTNPFLYISVEAGAPIKYVLVWNVQP
jgi:hypothetical protein